MRWIFGILIVMLLAHGYFLLGWRADKKRQQAKRVKALSGDGLDEDYATKDYAVKTEPPKKAG